MNTHLKETQVRLTWLRLGLIGLALVGVISFLLITNSEPVEAAPEATLQSRNQLIVTGEGCSLVLINATQTRARMRCEAFTPTATATATTTAESGLLDSSDDQNSSFKFTSDVVSAPDAKIRRTIKPGKKLNAQAALDCTLNVVEQSATEIRIKCKPKPATKTPTPTATRTRTPTRTNTPRPAQTNLYIGNYTGGELCYEVYDTGVGRKCFGGGDSFYGSFPSGVYTYKVEARCGSLSDTINFPSGNRIQSWECKSGISARSGEMSRYDSVPGALATPAR